MSPQFARSLKRVEVAWRSLWIRALTRLMRRGPAVGAPAWGSREHRVLFLRHDRIGDMILSTGLLRAIATSHSTIKLDVLASPANAPVLRENPHVDSTIVFDRSKPTRYSSTLRLLRRTKYDAVIDCMPTAPSLTTLLLMWASGATHRVGVAGRGNDDALTLPVAPNRDAVHVVDQLGALAAAFGVDRNRVSFHPQLYLAHESGDESDDSVGRLGHQSALRLLVNVSAVRAFALARTIARRCLRHALARDSRCVSSSLPRQMTVTGRGDARDSGAGFVSTPRCVTRLLSWGRQTFLPRHRPSSTPRRLPAPHRDAIHGTASMGSYQSPGRECSVSTDRGSLDVPPVLAALMSCSLGSRLYAPAQCPMESSDTWCASLLSPRAMAYDDPPDVPRRFADLPARKGLGLCVACRFGTISGMLLHQVAVMRFDGHGTAASDEQEA